MPSSKKNRNTKDGGIAAAVTKQAAAKFSSRNAIKTPSSSGSSPSARSPEIRPENGNPPAPSPILDALSTTSISASTAQSALDWADGLGSSPGNLTSLAAAEWPPTEPSSYEDTSRLHTAWSPRSYGSPPASRSPPPVVKRPLNFQMDGHSSPAESRGRQAAVAATATCRRGSVNSQYSHVRSGSHPQLPHHPQPHFYGTPELDFGGPAHLGLKAGERGYHFGFDALPRHQMTPAPGSDTVVLAGYEGGLEVYAVTKRGLEPTASLKGLRGGVFNAKILPWLSSTDAPDVFPLVAVVIHGPVIAEHSTDQGPGTLPNSRAPSARGSTPASPRLGGEEKDGTAGRPNQAVEYYQTTVEVYSLNTGQLVDVLLRAPTVPLNNPFALTSRIFQAPSPTGSFVIKADAGSVVVASGSTGECWAFRQLPVQPHGPVKFGCVAKVWTSIQQAPRTDVSEEADRANDSVAPMRSSTRSPILSLSGRWMAYSPPAPSSQITLRAQVSVPLLGKALGLASATPPQLPQASVDVDLPIEGMMNKFVRGATQELLQGAKWVGQQGLQAWNSYWNKSPNQSHSQPRSPPAPIPQWGASYPPRHNGSQFPPTHGSPGQAVYNDPGLISIVNLETLGYSSSLHPVATFSAPLGCSFLSFSPSGLSLFSASSKGDVQTVWDLMRVQFSKSSPLQPSSAAEEPGTRVRQIAHFSRLTVARIVDVSWTKPNGERIAMVTERGTVHLLDMPASAFAWPPPRRRRTPKEGASAASSEPASSAASIASSAIGGALTAVRPLVSRQRRSSMTSTALTGAAIVDSASHGGRFLAASISSSLGRTGNAINQLRHTGENRVSLPQSRLAPVPSCLTWITGKRYHSLFVAAEGLVRTFPTKSRQQPARNSQPRARRGNLYKDFKVPTLPDDIVAESVKRFLNGDDDLVLSDRELDAGNTVTLEATQRTVRVPVGPEASIPQAEIESSAPYQPFHTDRRIALLEYEEIRSMPSALNASVVYADPSSETPGSSKRKKARSTPAQPPAQPASTMTSRKWAFGQKINATKLDLGLPAEAVENLTQDGHRALPSFAMERVLQVGENDEQIVVTTRRRRGARHAEHDDEDGFFEDDCEVLDFADQRV